MIRDLKGQEANWNRDTLSKEISQRITAVEIAKKSQGVFPPCCKNSRTPFWEGVLDFVFECSSCHCLALCAYAFNMSVGDGAKQVCIQF